MATRSRLGYWVGRSNTPNSLTNRAREPERDHIDWWAEYIAPSLDGGDDLRIMTDCPNPDCAAATSTLEARHRARSACGTSADLRRGAAACTSPTTRSTATCQRSLVCTVDKLAHVARADQFVSILAGPAYRCPEHGYFTRHEAVFEDELAGAPERDDRCLAGDVCTRDAERVRARRRQRTTRARRCRYRTSSTCWRRSSARSTPTTRR